MSARVKTFDLEYALAQAEVGGCMLVCDEQRGCSELFAWAIEATPEADMKIDAWLDAHMERVGLGFETLYGAKPSESALIERELERSVRATIAFLRDGGQPS